MAQTEPLDPVESATVSDTTIPILEERIRIETRQVTTGVAKVHVTVSEHDETVEAMLNRQDVVVDRVPVGAFVDVAPAVRQEGDVIIVPVFEERLVTEKRIFLTEELRIRINENRQATTQTVRLRREHAEVDFQPQKGTPT